MVVAEAGTRGEGRNGAEARERAEKIASRLRELRQGHPEATFDEIEDAMRRGSGAGVCGAREPDAAVRDARAAPGEPDRPGDPAGARLLCLPGL